MTDAKEPPFPEVSIAGVRIHACTMKQVAGWLAGHATVGPSPMFVTTPNAQHVLLHARNASFRRAYSKAALSVPDGMSLVWASRFLGAPLPERVTGVDLMTELCGEAARRGLKVFLLGGREGAATRAAKVLSERFPGLRIAGTLCPPLGFDIDNTSNSLVLDAVRSANPDILFVALGAPKQELWLAAHLKDLHVPVSLGIGGSFELIAGMLRRAPKLLQHAGLEWLFRLATEPRRLWRRYVLGNPQFMWLVLRQWLDQRTKF